MESLHRFNVIRQPHNRFRTLRSGTKVLCSEREHGLQKVTDFFVTSDGNLLKLECGCRRLETAQPEKRAA